MWELLEAIENTGFATWVREAPTVLAYSTVLACHTFGMAFLVGLSGMIALRALGFARALPLAPMGKFFPFDLRRVLGERGNRDRAHDAGGAEPVQQSRLLRQARGHRGRHRQPANAQGGFVWKGRAPGHWTRAAEDADCGRVDARLLGRRRHGRPVHGLLALRPQAVHAGRAHRGRPDASRPARRCQTFRQGRPFSTGGTQG